jgi:hypothetical protein
MDSSCRRMSYSGVGTLVFLIWWLWGLHRDVVRWGKNIETGQRRASRRAGAATYSSASALETLVSFQSLVLIYGALHYLPYILWFSRC